MEDRTAEFMSMAQALPQGPSTISSDSATTATTAIGRYGGAGAAASQKTQGNPAYTELKEFHKTAADISKDIAATSHMLAELTSLVRNKSKSLFVDDGAKINNLVIMIKSQIENLNGRLDQAANTISVQKRRLGRNSQAGQEASNLVYQLQEEFGQAAAGFKKVLQQRTDSMKTEGEQQRQIYGEGANTASGNVVSLDNKPPVYEAPSAVMDDPSGIPNMSNNSFPTLDLTSGMSAGESTSSGQQLPRPHGAAGGADSFYSTPEMRLRRQGSDYLPASTGSTAAYHGGSGAPLTPLDIMRMEQESNQQQSLQLIPDQSYLRERADAMEQVESNIVELGTIFNKLAGLVSEHRDLVQRVEDNVNDADTNMTMSMNVLTDTLTSLQTNRALFLKVFGILVAFIIMFIIFFA